MLLTQMFIIQFKKMKLPHSAENVDSLGLYVWEGFGEVKDMEDRSFVFWPEAGHI